MKSDKTTSGGWRQEDLILSGKGGPNPQATERS